MNNEIPEFKFCLSDGLDSSFLPQRANKKDSGWDVRSASKEGIVLVPGYYIKIPLGFKVFSPSGWWLHLLPRSSSFIKRYLHPLYGVIDEGYEGDCYFCCQYIPDDREIQTKHRKKIKFGERIGQLIPYERKEMICSSISKDEFDELCKGRNLSRGTGGFGSSGGGA